MSGPNVLGKRARPTKTAYCSAVSGMIAGLKKRHGLNGVGIAERLGVDSQTIHNWENGLTAMDPVKLLEVEDEFGAGSIDPVLEIAGSNAVPVDMTASGDALVALVHAVQLLVTARAKDSPGGVTETREELFAMEAALVEARRATTQMLAHIKRLRDR